MYHIPRPFSLSKIINTTNCLNYKIYLCWKSPTVLLKPPTQTSKNHFILCPHTNRNRRKERKKSPKHGPCQVYNIIWLYTTCWVTYCKFYLYYVYIGRCIQMTKETLTLHSYIYIYETDQHKTYCFRIPHIYYHIYTMLDAGCWTCQLFCGMVRILCLSF